MRVVFNVSNVYEVPQLPTGKDRRADRAERWKQVRPRGGSHRGTASAGAGAGAALDKEIPHTEAASAKAARRKNTKHWEKLHGSTTWALGGRNMPRLGVCGQARGAGGSVVGRR